MKNLILLLGVILMGVIACQTQATEPEDAQAEPETPKEMYAVNGYDSQEAWGEHIVMIAGCEDCHSPKRMTENGPEPDPALRFSGNPADATAPDLDRAKIEQNGYGACNSHFTAWAGPWGISYAANISSDATGIGNWTEEQFFKAIREGKLKGMDNTRPLLPPMPWFNFRYMTDAELSAVFAFLKSTDPVDNVVAQPQPPMSAMEQ